MRLVTVRHPCCGWRVRIADFTVGFNVAGHRRLCPGWRRG